MKYAKIKKNPKQLLSLTGFSISEFEAFLPTFKYHWEEYYSHFILKGRPRIRTSYTIKTSVLPYVSDKLLSILSYSKTNPLPDYRATLFDMTQCNKWIHLLSDILLKTWKTLGELPDRNYLRV